MERRQFIGGAALLRAGMLLDKTALPSGTAYPIVRTPAANVTLPATQ